MVFVDSPVTLFSMAKGQRRNPIRQPTRRVWRRIYLEAWRRHRGLSIEDLAAKSGVSPALISLIENAKSGGSPETLEKLADALDCEVGELFDIKPEPGGALLRLWVKDSDRERVEAMADALSKLE